MDVYLSAILLSCGAGALYATLASGLLLTYRSSGVINFAYGGLAMYGAYLYSQLRMTGQWLVPPLPNPLVIIQGIARLFGARVGIVNWPTFISTGGPQGAAVSMVIAIVTTGLLGLVIYLGIFRPMRDAPPLAKVVASIGVMITLEAVVTLRYGTQPQSVPESLPSHVVHVLGRAIPVDRLYLAAIGLGVAVLLAVLYRFTKFGWATEASASSEKGAIITGISPDRIAAINWSVAAMLAAAMGILVAPITALSPDNFTLFVLPALAAMLLAGFRSFIWCAIASFVVAALQGVAGPLAQDYHWLPSTGLSDGVPLVLIIIAMIWRGSSLPTRSSLSAEKLPPSPEPRMRPATVATASVLALAGALFLPFEYRTAIVTSAIAVILTMSLLVLTGLIGQISLMQMALAGVAAVLVMKMTTSWGVPYVLAALLAALAAMAAGLVASIPALRIRGTHLAIVTLAAALAFDSIVLQNPNYLNQALGMPSPTLFGLQYGIDSPFAGRSWIPNPVFAVVILALLALVVYVYVNLRRSGSGRAFLAVRSNERAAAGVGVSVRGMKLAAFGVSGFIAGLAGVLMAYQFQGVSEPTFATMTSLTALAVAYLGGISRLSGAIVAGLISAGGLLTVWLDNVINMPQYYLLVTGIGLMLAAVNHPEGLAGTNLAALRERLRHLIRRQPATQAGTEPLLRPVGEPAAHRGAPLPVGTDQMESNHA